MEYRPGEGQGRKRTRVRPAAAERWEKHGVIAWRPWWSEPWARRIVIFF